MTHHNNVKPGDEAIVTDSISGPSGPSVGARVLVHADVPRPPNTFDDQYVDAANALGDPFHYCPPSPYEKPHTVHGKIWPVTRIDGKPFLNEHGHILPYGEIPDKWLRRVEPPKAPPVTEETESPIVVTV